MGTHYIHFCKQKLPQQKIATASHAIKSSTASRRKCVSDFWMPMHILYNIILSRDTTMQKEKTE